jgi:hypothetical protein
MGKFNDSPYFLDIFYRSFDKDIEYMGQDYGHTRYYTTKVLDLEKHNICEEFELQFESSWRGDFLKDSKKAAPTKFEEEREERYTRWVEIHSRAIYALEGHLVRNNFSDDVRKVRKMLLRLWLFLPQEFSRCGTHIDLQKRHVKWITQQTTVSGRLKINDFLDRLVINFCNQDKGALAKRINLFQGDSEIHPTQYRILIRDMLGSGAYAILVKRLLLQTPLLFWPAVFKRGVSSYFEENTKPPDVYYSSIGDLVVQCGNTRWGGGYEVSILWANLLQYENPEDISRCRRAYEYRFIQMPTFVPCETKVGRGKAEDHTDDTGLPRWCLSTPSYDRNMMVSPLLRPTKEDYRTV